MTVRQEVIELLNQIIDWTISNGRLKSLDHSEPKRLAERALHILTPPLDWQR